MKKIGGKKILAVLLAAALAAVGMTEGIHRGGEGQAVPAFTSARLPQRQLVLDAGHGGEDGGAVSLTGVAESVINLEIVQRLDQLLGFYGTAPILVRDRDVSIYDPGCNTLRQKKVSDLHNRVALVENTENCVLISIHQNTFQNPSYHGAQVFFRTEGESEALGVLIQETLREGLDPKNKRTPTKIPSSVYLMAHITCPAVLVECGFLSNSEEEARLRDGGYQTKLALCIASAWLRSGEIWTGKAASPVV